MATPLVSVICLCYNHKRFIREAVESVINQTHPALQLILVDDASTDGSVEEIRKLKEEFPKIELVLLDENTGNCKAFNRGLSLATGDYLIDLAGDDVLMPTRVEEGIKDLQSKGAGYGVHFSDAEWIDEDGSHLYFHSQRFPHERISEGDIYKELISKYFICPPTVMFTREVIQHLGGYDENLSYEDFDFWIRSSRKFKYCYSTNCLVKKRVTKQAQAKKQFQLFSGDSESTFRVCEKIVSLNQTYEEQDALTQRIRYEIKLNLRLLNFGMVFKYLKLLRKNRLMKYST